MISKRSFATHTTERLVARIYPLACASSGVEVLINAWSQRSLVGPMAALTAVIFASVLIGMVAAGWITGDSRAWFRVHAIVVALMLLTWPLLQNQPWPHGLHPWVWWAVGNAAISAVIGFAGILGMVFEVGLCAGWVWLATSDFGGNEGVQSALMDAGYVLFLAATIGAIIWALRTRAKLVDNLHLRTNTALAEKNRVDAIQQERISAAALVHTKVVAALDLAYEASSEADWKKARTAAIDAERTINARLTFTDLQQPAAQAQDWARNLRRTISTLYPNVLIDVTHVDGISIPNPVTLAFTESVMQAVDNSVRHAGPKAKTRLKIEGLQAGIKVIVSDTGKGFRLSEDGRGQVGIHRSILERCRSVGIKPNLDTAPGKGCRVVLQWVKI